MIFPAFLIPSGRTPRKRPRVSWLVALLLATVGFASPASADTQREVHEFSVGEDHFLLDGKPFQIRCGEVHFARIPREYWRDRLKMCKAMGLNTVCAYLFWNFHEPRPGEFEWSGRADAAAFCQLAHEEGLWVILRPGPYACAEWTMGGLPWWLLRHDDIRLRSTDPRFLEASRRYLAEVGRQLGDMQVTRGGPILMVQVENEYGFYGNDKEYMGQMRQALIDAGFEAPLFACNPVQHLNDGRRDDLLPVVNFGSNPAGGFEALRRVYPRGPLMCGEYYSGWFDTWGSPHHIGDVSHYYSDLEYMLEQGASFSIYMAHGGTSLGLWAGADRPFKPDISSYDYDAPINERGEPTEKFWKTRALFARHLQTGEELPTPPDQAPPIAISSFKLYERMPLKEALGPPQSADVPGTFEEYELPNGCILYRATLPAGAAGEIVAEAVHDFGWVSLDGKPIAVLDRRKNAYSFPVPERTQPARIEILVYAMGRVNFGVEVHDRKGLHSPVVFKHADGAVEEIRGWEIQTLPLNDNLSSQLAFSNTNESGAAFYRGEFHTDVVGDTFLDMSRWGKGVVWINGQCLGRYWNIGPVQTMYTPGVWMRPGKNEVVVLDLVGPEAAELQGLSAPILDKLRPDLDFSGPTRMRMKLRLQQADLVQEGTMAPGDQVTRVDFPPTAGRYVCLESIDAYGDQRFAGAAEIDLVDASGNRLSHEGWRIASVSSEERVAEDGTAENAIDGQTSNGWHTEWKMVQPTHPHHIVIDLGKPQELASLIYVPLPRNGDEVGGRIRKFRIYIGDQLATSLNAPKS